MSGRKSIREGLRCMKFKVKAVIFDLDGVICSTDKFHYQAWKSLADDLGILFNEEINHRLRGVSRMDSLNINLERADREYTLEEKTRLAEEKNRIYRQLLETMTRADLSEEVWTTLQKLREKGYQLAIGSSSKNAKLILERLELGSFFDAVADGTDIMQSKPAPEVFLCAAKKLGVEPEKCAVIEDAKVGIEAAKAGGMTALALFGDARGCGMEDYDLRSFADLLNVME